MGAKRTALRLKLRVSKQIICFLKKRSKVEYLDVCKLHVIIFYGIGCPNKFDFKSSEISVSKAS